MISASRPRASSNPRAVLPEPVGPVSTSARSNGGESIALWYPSRGLARCLDNRSRHAASDAPFIEDEPRGLAPWQSIPRETSIFLARDAMPRDQAPWLIHS